MYRIGTLFRILNPLRADMCTAVQMKDGIVAMSPRSDPVVWERLEDWTSYYPSQLPCKVETDTHVADLLDMPQQREPVTQWKIPRKSQEIALLKWPRHLYTLISECGLLEREDLRAAYQHLLDVLTEHRRELKTRAPHVAQKYRQGVQFYWSVDMKHEGIRDWVVFEEGVDAARERTLLYQVLAAYYPVYELIRDVVVPYMKERQEEDTRQREIERFQKLLANTVESHRRHMESSKWEEERLLGRMKSHQEHLNQLDKEGREAKARLEMILQNGSMKKGENCQEVRLQIRKLKQDYKEMHMMRRVMETKMVLMKANLRALFDSKPREQITDEVVEAVKQAAEAEAVKRVRAEMAEEEAKAEKTEEEVVEVAEEKV